MLLSEIEKLKSQVDVIYMSHSGGKDSQAALAYLVRHGLKDKIKIIHADLGIMEWEEMKPWIETISFGIPVHVTQADEDFFQLCERTGRIPDGKRQFCTDYLKTEPIKKWIHDDMYQNNYRVAFNVTGMRAEESKRRTKKSKFSLSKGEHTSKMHMPKKHPDHIIFDWMPIFDYLVDDVFNEISQAGQRYHSLYDQGFSRLSCVACVNGKIWEHQEAARRRPELFRRFAEMERRIGKSVRMRQKNRVKYRKYMDEYITALQ